MSIIWRIIGAVSIIFGNNRQEKKIPESIIGRFWSKVDLSLVVGQVLVGACSVGFFSNLYYQGTNVAGYIVFALVKDIN